MNKNLIKGCAQGFFLLWILNPSLIIAAETPNAILQAKLNNIQQMTANFSQRITAKGHEISRSYGNMALERPGHLRWETKKPMEQLIIADGKKLWVYDIDLEQVTVKKQTNNLSDTAALFLSNYDHAATNAFKVSFTQQNAEETYHLQAKAKKENFHEIWLIFKDNILYTIKIIDQLGQHTTINFNKIVVNHKLAANLFQFTPPKNVDLLNQ